MLTLLGGPLLLLYARAVTASSGRFWMHLIPATSWALWALLALALSAPPHIGPTAFLLHQFVYTAVVIRTLWRGQHAAMQKSMAVNWAKLVIATVMLVHLASLLRLSFPVAPLHDVVPET